MQNTELNTVATTIDKFSDIAQELPFESEQAWTLSSDYMASYLRQHADNGAGFGAEEVSLFASGRLDWLLRETGPSLCGLFSEGDIIALLDCYQGSMFFPDQMNSIASDLCDHLGVELENYQGSNIALLVGTLLDLSPVQRVTLVDALEQTWHRGMRMESKSPREFFATLGIDLS